MSSEALLKVDDVSHAFGGLQAVDGCSFEVQRGTISALIGPNGAGKSTLVNVIAGALALQHGSIHFDGHDISGLASFRIANRGLIRTFQISREFGHLSVLENMLVPPPRQVAEGLWNAVLRPHLGAAQDRALVAKAVATLDTFGLYEMRDEYASNLSGGQKRLLELARAVMAEPKLLLLDEPMAGVNPTLIQRIVKHIRELRGSGITFLIVEHNLDVVDQMCDHVVVMALGSTLASGLLSELRQNPAVVDAYLGSSHHANAAR